MTSEVGSVLEYVFLDLMGSVLRFPVWWYTDGAWGTLRWIARSLSFRWRSYDIALWIRNFFIPMYGFHDWTGRLISVWTRFFVIVGRMIGFAVESMAMLLLMLFWLIAPPLFFLFFLDGVFSGAFTGQLWEMRS